MNKRALVSRWWYLLAVIFATSGWLLLKEFF
jgi:hypothetical protein